MIPKIPVLREAANEMASWMSGELEALVAIESPSDEPACVNRANDHVAGLAAALGATVNLHRQKDFGNILELHLDHDDGRRPVLLLGHLDTVWPVGALADMPWREADGRLWGPGVLDMKAGVLMAITAFKILKKLGLSRPATLLLNSEEEVGSPVSRAITERVALGSEAVFVLEPAQGLAYKTSRKGVGQYKMQVTGVASHAGVDFERGHSAIREMARLIETVFNFTDLSRKRTVNCGRMSGGSGVNVVAAHASADVDVRVASMEDAEELDRLFRGLRCSDGGCRVEVTGGINRPPMERTGGTVALYERARGYAAELGFELGEASTGGGSDGNFTSALGVPTLDGMGAVGDGAHAAHESVVIEHLAPRTALLAAMIAGT